MVDNKPEPKAKTEGTTEVVEKEAVVKTLEVEIVKHDGSFLDLRHGKEIRRVKGTELPKQYKWGAKFQLPETVWQEAKAAPYAKRK